MLIARYGARKLSGKWNPNINPSPIAIIQSPATVKSGIAFGTQVAPLQVRLRALAQAGASGGEWDKAQYHRLSRRWELWGLFAIVAPLAAFALMVFKPS